MKLKVLTEEKKSGNRSKNCSSLSSYCANCFCFRDLLEPYLVYATSAWWWSTVGLTQIHNLVNQTTHILWENHLTLWEGVFCLVADIKHSLWNISVNISVSFTYISSPSPLTGWNIQISEYCYWMYLIRKELAIIQYIDAVDHFFVWVSHLACHCLLGTNPSEEAALGARHTSLTEE